MPNTFTDLSDECAREGKIGRFLDMANPALCIRWVVMSAVELTVQYKLFLFRLDTLAIPGLRKTISNKTYNCEIEIQTVSVVRKHCNI